MKNQKVLSTISTQSKKINKTEEIQSLQKAQINFFIDPFLSHRIYRDFLIPNHQMTTFEPIHHFKNYLSCKSLAQVHMRERGVVFQFNDFSPDHITPLGLLEKQLNSLGNKPCHELAECLPMYYQNFEAEVNASKTKNVQKYFENEPLITSTSTFGVLLSEIDKIFDIYMDDMVYSCVYQDHGGLDDRLSMICFNNNLAECLAEENLQTIPPNEIADQLLEIFTHDCIDEYIEQFTGFIKTLTIKGLKTQNNPLEDFHVSDIQTIFGRFQAKFRLHSFPITINGWNFNLICSIYKKDEQNPKLKDCLSNKRIENKTQKISKKNTDWARLYKCFYPNKN